jgi:hypothetical protein
VHELLLQRVPFGVAQALQLAERPAGLRGDGAVAIVHERQEPGSAVYDLDAPERHDRIAAHPRVGVAQIVFELAAAEAARGARSRRCAGGWRASSRCRMPRRASHHRSRPQPPQARLAAKRIQRVCRGRRSNRIEVLRGKLHGGA